MVQRCVATGCSNTYKDGSSFHATQRCGSSGLRRCKGLVPIGKGQAITPFCAVSISQTTALKKTQLLQQDLGSKNEGVSSQMLPVPMVFQRRLPHSSTEAEAQDDPSTSRKRSISADCSPVQQKRAAFEKRERIRVTQYSSHIASYIASLLNILLADCTRSTGVKYTF